MAISQPNQVQIKNVAKEALETFAAVAYAARSGLDSRTQGVTATNVAVNNTLTSPEVVKNQWKISNKTREGYQLLCKNRQLHVW